MDKNYSNERRVAFAAIDPYLQTNIVKENVQKVDYKPEAERSFNYPIHALEEIVGNCLYHYDE